MAIKATINGTTYTDVTKLKATDGSTESVVTLAETGVIDTPTATKETTIEANGTVEIDVTNYKTIKITTNVSGGSTKTLESISAVANTTSYAVGTSASDLDITVTGTWSDGSTSTITGWTATGTIADGENVIAIEYNGLTCTVTVTGIEAQTETLVFSKASGWASGTVNDDGTYTFVSKIDSSGTMYVESVAGNIYGGTLKFTAKDQPTMEASSIGIDLHVLLIDENGFFVKTMKYLSITTAGEYTATWKDVQSEGTSIDTSKIKSSCSIVIPDGLKPIISMRRSDYNDGTITNNATFVNAMVNGTLFDVTVTG